jgi:hypothetical protein
VLLIAPPDIQALMQRSPQLREFLDPMLAEERGYSILYCPEDSVVLDLISTVWDRTDYDLPKGVLEVEL